ncbi:anti-sigma factor [Edaphobacter aggregans]|uniref:anti-sigma factor n=1 Tax=Edaphobacter aggregans TaxID=570835 RepID=UPI000555E854|nr:anti-sigma factor [Edaphobacter aggregans]
MSVAHYEPADLALFAMQLLPRDESATMSAHVADCTYCRQELAHVQGDLAVYAHTVEMHSPPALTRERLLNQVVREKRQATPIEQAERVERVERIEAAVVPPPGYTRTQNYAAGLGSGRYRTEDEDQQPSLLNKLVTNVFPWIGWAFAAGLAVTAGGLYHEREAQRTRLSAQAGEIDRLSADAAAAKQLLSTITDPSAKQVTLSRASTPAVPPAPLGRATYVADKGALVFIASGLDPLETYKTYELWLIPADGRDPIPAGTFHPDSRGNASVILPPLPKGIEAKAFGVTIEDEGGSQTPTMPIVLAGS